MSNNKLHLFCETPEEKCTMNYCDENGCINRKRNLVGESIEMSNNKQSSVEWLISQLQRSKDWHRVLNETSQMSSDRVDIIEQAKAMHKEEIINTWYNGYINQSSMPDEENCGEIFYNETFGGNNE